MPVASRIALLTIFLAALINTSCNSPALVLPSLTPRQNPDLVLVSAGWFLMGENDGRLSNGPQHKVYLDAFYIQRTEVTRQDFAAFMPATGYGAPGWGSLSEASEKLLPVVGVRWRDADAYCHWRGLRLPSEAEWEKAARGLDGKRFPWGNEWTGQNANTAQDGPGQLTSVGSYPKGASPFGVLDMSGNATEWVADFYDATYYLSSPDHNPLGPTIITDHGLRGGSFASPPEQVTVYFRDSSHSVMPNLRVGFRCASSLPR